MESDASQGRGSYHIIPDDNDNTLSGCEQLGGSRYHRQKSHRDFAPSFAAEHRRGSYGEQRSPDLAGKYGRRPWNMMSPALLQLLRSFRYLQSPQPFMKLGKIPGTSYYFWYSVGCCDVGWRWTTPRSNQLGMLWTPKVNGEKEENNAMLISWQMRTLHGKKGKRGECGSKTAAQ